jgi:protein-disulfide isomerase
MPSGGSLTARSGSRVASLLVGAGLIAFALLTIRHFFAANYPSSVAAGAACSAGSLFSCDASALAPIAQLAGVPIGWLGVMTGALLTLGALFPSDRLERTNATLSALNAAGVLGLAGYTAVVLKTLCLFCIGYWVFALAGFALFWRAGARFLRPSLAHLATFGVVTAAGGWGVRLYHDAKQEAQAGGAAIQAVQEYFSLPRVNAPSVVSPYWTVRSTARFEDAPIQVVEYADFLCSDCLFLVRQLERLEREFRGELNVAFQFFPLDAQCNAVVEKNKHPGACDLSYIAAYDTSKFRRIHDEIFANFAAAKTPAWRRDLARRYGVEAALTDSATRALVQRFIGTGAEYERTSEQYRYGIRSTPTMIVNNRMIIGTLPYEQLRAIFRALVRSRAQSGQRFMENWVP